MTKIVIKNSNKRLHANRIVLCNHNLFLKNKNNSIQGTTVWLAYHL